jgi:RNA polymerase sigma factor for flagellar operon FliA
VIAELVREHRPLVRAIACRVMRDIGLPAREEHLDDLLSFGDGGLFEAAQRFDPARGVKFATFATYRIRGAMVDGLRALGRYPRPNHKHPVYVTSIEAVSADVSKLADDQPDPEESAIQHQLLRGLREAVAALEEVERQLIVGYFFEGMTLEDLGREIGGLSKSWTCRLLGRTLSRLRDRMGRT